MGAVNVEEGKSREEKAAKLGEALRPILGKAGRAGYQIVCGQIWCS